MSWLDALQPASWRKHHFGVFASRIVAGRKTAQHDYPFRDTVWIEDLGKQGRQYQFQGFVVSDKCYAMEQAMLSAVEQAGPGVLVHPSLGARTVSLVSFSSGITFEQGRVVTFDFTFVEGGSPLYPSTIVSTQSQVTGAASISQLSSHAALTSQSQSSSLFTGPVSVTNPDGTSTTYLQTFSTPPVANTVAV